MRKSILLLGALLLAGCDLGAGPVQPKVGMPAAFDGAKLVPASATTGATAWPAIDWWRAFGSAELDQLEAQAKAGNLDIAAAAARVRQAEAQLRVSGSTLWPKLNLTGGLNQRGPVDDGSVIEGENKKSRSTFSSDLNGSSSSSSSTTHRTTAQVGLAASYELDFWGKNQDNVDAATASLNSGRYDRETVALTVNSSVASTYLQILTLRERIGLAQQNLANAQQVLRVVDSKVRNGAVSSLDLAQQKAQVAAQQGAIPPLQLQEKQALNALALLLGRNPEGFTVTATGLHDVNLPSIGVGLPAELLTRRPDIQKAEADLGAANANLQAARAAMLPSIDLSSSVTLEVLAASLTFGGVGAAYTAAASLVQPIFDAGELKGQKDVAAGKQLELVQTYQAAILTALADVENSLASIDSLKTQQQWQVEQVTAAGTAFTLAQSQYRNGSTELLPVLDAQRTVFQAEDSQLSLTLSQMQAAVALYKALGGGWQVGNTTTVASTNP